MNRIRKTDWGKIAKYLDQEMNTAEQTDFEKTVESDREYSRILESVRTIWNSTKTNKNMLEVNTDSAWEKLKNRIENQEKTRDHTKSFSDRSDRNIISFALRIAAVLLITAGLSITAYKLFINPRISEKHIVVRAEPGRMVQTILPDGSVVHIKANSEINWHTGTSGTRELTLKGEAFFEVVHDPDRPFTVYTGPAIVKVYGTSFSVESEESSHTVNVFVESGLVSLTNKTREGQSVTIEPGFMGILSEKGIEKKVYRNENLLAWKTGKLEFRMTAMDSVITDLNHTYGTSIILENPGIAGCHFTGTFLNHQPVDTVLEVLKTAFNLEISRTGSDIMLSGPDCK
jgi:transmembrane sensor